MQIIFCCIYILFRFFKCTKMYVTENELCMFKLIVFLLLTVFDKKTSI